MYCDAYRPPWSIKCKSADQIRPTDPLYDKGENDELFDVNLSIHKYIIYLIENKVKRFSTIKLNFFAYF